MDRLSVTTLAVAKKYTDKTVVGLGGLKGSPCTIEFTEAIPGGTRVTFGWTGTDGTHESTHIDVMDGKDGKGIRTVTVDNRSHLIITYDDGTTYDAGKIEVQAAVDSVNGKTGEVILVLSDIVNVGDGLIYDPVTNTLSVSQQAVEDTVEDVLDDKAEGYVEDGIADNKASESDIDNLFN